MFKIKIPLTQRMIEIFIGVEEVDKYNRVTKKMGCDSPITEKDMSKNGGFSYGSAVWVHGFTIGILLHEISHAMDAITLQMGCQREDEFKAYMWGHIGLCIENEYVSRLKKRIKEAK